MKPVVKRILDLGIKYSSKICLLGYIAGIVWMAILAHPSFSNHTYFSENALLPAMVDTQYDTHNTIKSLKRKVEEESQGDRSHMVTWLMDKMTSIGLEAFQQNFTVLVPEEVSEEGKIVGRNVYGILRAPRVARTEALVFCVSFKNKESEAFTELVLLLSLAEHFRNNIYWAKDIIFLVTDQKELGMQSWLDEYHGITSKYARSSPMLGRSGSIQAAINLELQAKTINQIEVLVEGLNGQLPNLDLVNMVVRLCEDERIPVSLKTMELNYDVNDGWDEYRRALGTMGLMMFSQASGRPSANHGLFPKYGIEAVTLRGKHDGPRSSVGIARLGRALEGMFRSLNNLLERFHQSFFLYLLSSAHRYVSIGLYMPPLGCLMIGPTLVAVACWVHSAAEDPVTVETEVTKNSKNGDSNESESSKEQIDDTKDEDKMDKKGTEEDSAVMKTEVTKKCKESDSKENEGSMEQTDDMKDVDETEDRETKEDGKACDDNRISEDELAFTRVPRHVGKVFCMFLATHFVGFLIYVTPVVLRHLRPVLPSDLHTSTFTVAVMMVLFVSSLLLPFFLSLSRNFTLRDVSLLKSFALVVYTCTVGCLATLNFSFGFILAVFTVQPFTYVDATRNKLRRLTQVIAVLLSSPLSILFFLCLTHTFVTSPNVTSYETFLNDSSALFMTSLLSALRDSVLLGSWIFPISTLVLLPNWLLFWCIALV